jgi:hypothetical protein
MPGHLTGSSTSAAPLSRTRKRQAFSKSTPFFKKERVFSRKRKYLEGAKFFETVKGFSRKFEGFQKIARKK